MRRIGWVVAFLAMGSGVVRAAPDAPPPPGAGPEVVEIPQPFGTPIEPPAPPPPAPPPVQIQAQPPMPIEVPSAIYPIRTARLRLATVQGMNAAILGTEICLLIASDADDRRCVPVPFVLGAGVALAAGLSVRPGIDSDHISAINGGTVLGMMHGALVLGMSGLYWPEDEDARQIGAISIMASSQIVGTLAGHFIYEATDGSRNGVVDAAVTTGAWSGTAALMLAMGYADPWDRSAPHARQFGVILAATDVGVGLGVLIGRHTEFTPWRSLLVDGYSLLGGGLGLLIGLPVMLTDDDTVDESEVWKALGYSSILGFALGVAATTNVGTNQRMSRSYAFDLGPVRGGMTANVRGTF